MDDVDFLELEIIPGVFQKNEALDVTAISWNLLIDSRNSKRIHCSDSPRIRTRKLK